MSYFILSWKPKLQTLFFSDVVTVMFSLAYKHAFLGGNLLQFSKSLQDLLVLIIQSKHSANFFLFCCLATKWLKLQDPPLRRGLRRDFTFTISYFLETRRKLRLPLIPKWPVGPLLRDSGASGFSPVTDLWATTGCLSDLFPFLKRCITAKAIYGYISLR